MTPNIPPQGREGIPLSLAQDADTDVFQSLSRPGLYRLVVRGDAMMDAGIYAGDVVVIRPLRQARSGQIVVAMIDGEQPTLRRFYAHPDGITLAAENLAYAPQHYAPERVEIQGVLHSVHRFYRWQ